jgi:hypothetical protein
MVILTFGVWAGIRAEIMGYLDGGVRPDSYAQEKAR